MKSEKSTFRGIARYVNGLRFRLERIDNEGNVIDYVATSAMGSLTGDLVDGDEIEVVGKINKEGILIANKILNLKTRAYIMKSGLIDLLRNSHKMEETGTTHYPPLRFSGTSNDNSTTHMKSTWLYH